VVSRATLAVLVICLIAAPGCSALSESNTGGDETLTPVPVSAEGPTSTSSLNSPTESLPPGVSPNGTINVTRLVAAHESALANRTYRWTFSYSIAGEDGPERQNYTRLAIVGDDMFLATQSTPEASTNKTMYVVNDTGYLRTFRDQSKRFYTTQSPVDHYSFAFSGKVIRRFLRGVSADMTRVEIGGETYYRLYSAEEGVPRRLVTAYVTSEGLVRSVAIEYHDLRVRYDYTDLGGVTVNRPDWVSRMASAENSTDTIKTPLPTETN
jgi:hypothetical protein